MSIPRPLPESHESEAAGLGGHALFALRERFAPFFPDGSFVFRRRFRRSSDSSSTPEGASRRRTLDPEGERRREERASLLAAPPSPATRSAFALAEGGPSSDAPLAARFGGFSLVARRSDGVVPATRASRRCFFRRLRSALDMYVFTPPAGGVPPPRSTEAPGASSSSASSSSASSSSSVSYRFTGPDGGSSRGRRCPGRLRGRPPRRARPAAAAAQELGFEAREQRLLAGGERVRERGVAERRLALLVRQRLAIGGGDRDAGEPRAGHPRPRPRERGVSTPGVADEMVFSSTSQVSWKSACPRKSRPKRRVVGGNESFRDGKTLAGTRSAPRADRGGSARDAVCLGVPHLPP